MPTLLHLPYLFPSPLPLPSLLLFSFLLFSSVLCLCFQFLKVKSACATPPPALVIILILSPPHSPVPSSLSHCVYPIRPLSALTPSRFIQLRADMRLFLWSKSVYKEAQNSGGPPVAFWLKDAPIQVQTLCLFEGWSKCTLPSAALPVCCDFQCFCYLSETWVMMHVFS